MLKAINYTLIRTMNHKHVLTMEQMIFGSSLPMRHLHRAMQTTSSSWRAVCTTALRLMVYSRYVVALLTRIAQCLPDQTCGCNAAHWQQTNCARLARPKLLAGHGHARYGARLRDRPVLIVL
jgi:hypothetical protein